MSNRRPIVLLAAIGLTATCVYALWSPAPAPSVNTQAARITPQRTFAQALPERVPAAWTQDLHAAEVKGAYLTDRVMVRAVDDHTLAEVAAHLGLPLLREEGPSGYGAVGVEPGQTASLTLERLRSSGMVRNAGPMAIMQGALWPFTFSTSSYHELEWHHDEIGTDLALFDHDLSDITIAVLDTGVAYEDRVEDGISYAQAPGLANTIIVAPVDIINGDAHPNDDHQHGTHIASLIASDGVTTGVANGAKLMPVKVLDENNAGTELDLIDGLWHAIDNGADVINMSLAFREGYLPSKALSEALLAAADNDIVMVAAAGNTGAEHIAWPAASPWVVGVTATCQDGELAPYANRSTQVTVAAPGGCMHLDSDADGYPDGLVAESFDPSAPDDVGLWLMAGSSQASAVTAGSAAKLLAAGATALEVSGYLQVTASPTTDADFYDGVGGGQLNVGTAVDLTTLDMGMIDTGRYKVAMLPYLLDVGDGTVRPSVRLAVRAEDGSKPSWITAVVTLQGTTQQTLTCALKQGSCDMLGDAIDDDEVAGWWIRVDALRRTSSTLLMEPAIFASDNLDGLLIALSDTEATAGAPVGVYWEDGYVEELDADLAGSYTWINSGVGFASSPLGTLFTRSVFQDANVKVVPLDTGGVGFASSPLSFTKVRLLSVPTTALGGVGFASSPLGMVFQPVALGKNKVNLVAFDGVGFASSSLSMNAFTVYSPTVAPTSIYATPNLGGQVVGLSTGDTSAILAGTAVSGFMTDGGWSMEGTVPAATALGSSDLVHSTLVVTGTSSGTGARSVK